MSYRGFTKHGEVWLQVKYDAVKTAVHRRSLY